LPDKRAGFYAFQVSPFKGVSGVLNEECRIGTASGGGPFFQIQQGEVKGSSEDTFPRVTGDRLGQVGLDETSLAAQGKRQPDLFEDRLVTVEPSGAK